MIMRVICAIIILSIHGCFENNSSGKSTLKSYSFAIDTEAWCKDRGNGYTSPAAYSRLSQIVDGYAIFDGQVMLAIPANQIGSKLKEGMRLDSAARYIGISEKLEFEKQNGFKVTVELYDVINRSQYNSSERKESRCSE